MIEKMFNDNLLNFKIIAELVDYLRVKHGEEPSFTFACFKNGLDIEQTEDLLMFYSDITDEIAAEDIHLLDRNLLIEKTEVVEKINSLEITNTNYLTDSLEFIKLDGLELKTTYQKALIDLAQKENNLAISDLVKINRGRPKKLYKFSTKKPINSLPLL